jgi:hypothetical protein
LAKKSSEVLDNGFFWDYFGRFTKAFLVTLLIIRKRQSESDIVDERRVARFLV